MPEFPITDTHVHLAGKDALQYAWLEDNGALSGTYELANYDIACGDIDVGSIVFMECGGEPYANEVEWVMTLAEQDPRVKGILARIPIEEGEPIVPTLEAWAVNPLVKGVRRLIESEDVEFCLQQAFIDGVNLLPQFGLSFDICINHRHLANVLKFVAQCPDVQFILDHIGKPGIRDGLFEPWKSEIRQLAEFPNVTCKVSGVVTEAHHNSWTRDDVRPYVEHVIECFGFDRVTYGSDWFVQTLASTYPRWVETLDWIVADCSDDEQRKLYDTNAKRIYRVDD
ncbi:MAG TPA: amidohydrolase [Lentisphaeria bacterium]|nr:amidohydrolase [Lentisphaeria bacterium]